MRRAVVWMIVVIFVAGLTGVYAEEEAACKHKGGHKGRSGREHFRKSREEMLKKFDKDGNGELCEAERAEAKKAWEAKHKEMRAKMLEKFDADGDGELSEKERKAARAEWHKKHQAKGDDSGV